MPRRDIPTYQIVECEHLKCYINRSWVPSHLKCQNVLERIHRLTSIFENAKIVILRITSPLGGSPGLVVMGGDSHSKGRGFKSQHRILDGLDIFSHWFVVKIVLFVWKTPKINEKEAGDGPFFRRKKNQSLFNFFHLNWPHFPSGFCHVVLVYLPR